MISQMIIIEIQQEIWEQQPLLWQAATPTPPTTDGWDHPNGAPATRATVHSSTGLPSSLPLPPNQ
jgi:hypothetical protein